MITATTTLCAAFQDTVARHPDAVALRGPESPDYSWSAYAQAVRDLARGLLDRGLRRSETVAIMLRNRPEFHIADMGVLHAGGVPFSVDEVETVDRLVGFMEAAGVRYLITEESLASQAKEAARDRGEPLLVIVIDVETTDHGDTTLAELTAKASGDHDVDAIWPTVDPEDIATLIFTSGTTGAPKAVQLSHRAISVSLRGFERLAPVGSDGRLLAYLPMSHIAERFMSHYTSVAFGPTVVSVPDPATLYEDIRRVRPTRFFGVPRVYEKLADRARKIIDADDHLQAALDISLAAVRATQEGRNPEADEAVWVTEARKTLAPIGAALGLAQAEYLGVATAPSSYALLEFFLAIDLPVGDLWGMSEAIMCTMNPRARIKLGTVGCFLEDVEGRIDEHGEILVRGPNTFSGYLNDPKRSQEMLDEDGWLKTGDLGSIDADGYLSIQGRKKEMMITAAGVNIAPADIESAVKDASMIIDHAMAIADGRRYVTALVALDEHQLQQFAARNDLTGTLAELARDPQVLAEVARAVAVANEGLSRPESIREFSIVDQVWEPGGDEITTTMKLRRDVILHKYAPVVDAMYPS